MLAQITGNWTFVRVLRLLMGVIAVVYGIRDQDSLLGFAGTALMLLALLNIGCCGTQGCGLPTKGRPMHDPNRKIEFEEIK